MLLSPDCHEGKHRACHGDAWNFHDDAPIDCGCGCHASVGLVKPAEDAFGITHGITPEQVVGFAIAQLETLSEAVPTIRRLRGVIEQKQIEERKLMDADIGLELVDGRNALGIVIFREFGDHIETEIKGMKVDKVTAAKLFWQMAKKLKAMHEAETATPEEN